MHIFRQFRAVLGLGLFTKIDIALPDLNKIFSLKFGDRVYNELYDRTADSSLTH